MLCCIMIIDINEKKKGKSNLDKRDLYSKTQMDRDGKLKSKQTMKYVLYYVFYNEEPVYVGISNNFNIRKSQHFSSGYRYKTPNKRLYKHMELHDTDCYDMFIVAQTNNAVTIEDFEIAHIDEMRKLGLAKTNFSNGGDYVRYVDLTKHALLEFERELLDINEIIFDNQHEIDMRSFRSALINLDLDSLYSISGCNEHDIYTEYDKDIINDELIEFDVYMGHNIIGDLNSTISPQMLFSNITNGISTRCDIKESTLPSAIDVIRYIQDSEDAIEVYLALKCIFSHDYQDAIDVLHDYYNEEYEILEKITSNKKQEDFNEEHVY